MKININIFYLIFSQECTVTLTNTGKDIVEKVDISLHSKLNKGMWNVLYFLQLILFNTFIHSSVFTEKESAFFTWSKENLDTQLPIAVGSSASFTLYINAIGDFVNPSKLKTGTTFVFEIV